VARNPSPTLRRRELAARLRELRQQAELTIEEVADRLMVSATKISRLETGARVARLRDIRDLCDLYGVHEEERGHLMTVAQQSHEPSWWQQYDLPYSDLIGLETAAAAISDYKSAIVPALLQTAAYAREVLRAALPKPESNLLEQRLEALLTRQHLLTPGQPVRFLFILDEAVLHRAVGGPHVMHEQLRAIIDRAGQANMELRILPFSAGAHAAVESNFCLLEFEEKVSDVIYVEGLLGNVYRKTSLDLDRYRTVLQSLLNVSLTREATNDLVRKIIDQYASDCANVPVHGSRKDMAE
jgi:transcriptional regulator with XRE-family HTH domain